MCVCMLLSESANVCKLIISVGWRLEDILGIRTTATFLRQLMSLALEEYIMSLHFVIPCYE